MSQFLSNRARDIEPYVPGEQPKDKKYIKLNTNENPYPPSPKVLEAINSVTDGDLRLYPDPNCDAIKDAVAKYYKLDSNQVFVGNGSDEVLALCFMAFFNPGETIEFPDITYSFYPVYSDCFEVNYKTVALDEKFEIPMDAFSKECRGILIPNPNAPTGKAIGLSAIEDLLKVHSDKVVIIDEAYVDFGCDTAIPLIEKYPNLLVVQTLSKSRSLAGIRVGYAMGQAHLVDGLERIKNSFNSYTIDRLGLAGAVESIKDETYFEETRQKIIRTREKTVAELKKMNFECVESKANFIFIHSRDEKAEVLFKTLKEQGVLVRYFNKPRISEYLRVTIGTDEEMETFIGVLKNILNK